MTQKWKHREHLDKQGKFRVGDLVQLSAYGLKSEQNEVTLTIEDAKELLGLVVHISAPHNGKYPIRVQWINNNDKAELVHQFFFRELKLKRT